MSGKITRIPADVKDITIGHYTLTSTGLIVRGKPTYDEHEGVGVFIQRTVQASGWWLADWLRYGDERSDWQDKITQAIEQTGLSEKTLKNVRAIGAIDISRRRDDVEFSLHGEVASMHPADQVRWLAKAEKEGWTQRELRQNIHASKRALIIEGQAVLEGMYRVILADPPWSYADRSPTASGALGKAESHYPTLTIEDLCKLPVAAHALPNSVLFLWSPAPLLLQNPGPRDVLEAWGFTYKSNAVWDKVLGNFGHYFHVRHEHLIVATRGSCLPDQPTPMTDSVITIRRSDVHSEKPREVRSIIMKHWTQGPYLELFGRQRVEGWSVFGNDARLWARDAEATA